MTLQPGWWMTADAWMDEDGEHVWMAHDCTDRRVATMLPHPTWHAAPAPAGTGTVVVPSFACSDCGIHAMHVAIGPSPALPREPQT
jgi:hypothetical protein